MLVVKQNAKLADKKNEVFVFRFKNFTEFALKSKEFAQIVGENYSLISSKNYIDIAKKIRDEISLLAKEKLGIVETFYLETSEELNIYSHIYTHGKDKPFICEKAIIIGSNTVWSLKDTISAAMILMGVPFLPLRNRLFSMKVDSGFFGIFEKNKKIANREMKLSSRKRVSFTSKSISKPISFCVVC